MSEKTCICSKFSNIHLLGEILLKFSYTRYTNLVLLLRVLYLDCRSSVVFSSTSRVNY